MSTQLFMQWVSWEHTKRASNGRQLHCKVEKNLKRTSTKQSGIEVLAIKEKKNRRETILSCTRGWNLKIKGLRRISALWAVTVFIVYDDRFLPVIQKLVWSSILKNSCIGKIYRGLSGHLATSEPHCCRSEIEQKLAGCVNCFSYFRCSLCMFLFNISGVSLN